MRLTPAIVTVVTMLVPAVAAACPAAGGSCGATSGYLVALGVGLLAGMGSVGVERLFRKR